MTYRRRLLQLVAHLSIPTIVRSWIPPHPNSTLEWESVHDMRRRLQQPFKYKPAKPLHPEICRYLSEEECEETDKSMQEHVAAHKSLQLQVRSNPNLGSINALVLMIRFSDHVDRELVAKSDIEDMWSTRIAEWMDVNSQGRYDVKATVIDWITTDNTEEHYSFGQRGIVPAAQQMAWPALDILDNRPDFDFKDFDLDGNNQIDSLVIIHSGYGAETTSEDCFGTDYNNRIWAHAFASSSRDAWASKDGIRVNGYTIASALEGDCGAVPAKIGLAAHEYMHTFGLEDLYDGVDPLAAYGVGSFDIMANPYGPKDDADNPGHLSTYSKLDAEWVDPVEITEAGEFTLNAAEISDEAYRITLADFGVTAEYLLIENRRPLEFDVDLWNEGLMIYHVDTGADLMMNLGHPGQPGWPENGNHYFVAVLPKDGNYDLEKGENKGDAGDFWVPGDCLGPGEGNTIHPNTDTYGFGFVQETGIWLCVLEQIGTEITFRVGGFNGEPIPDELRQNNAETTAPTSATAAPTQATTAPTPATAAPTQATSAPTPATAAPTPATNAPTPATTAPTPATSAPTPATTAPTPATSAPTPATTAPTPATSAPTPATTAPTPATSAPTPATTAPTPATATNAPTPVTAAPTQRTTDDPTSALTRPPTKLPTSTPSVAVLAPTEIPFGGHQEITRRPASSPSYLQPFGPYSEFDVSAPAPGSSIEAPINGNPFLSNFGGTTAPPAERGSTKPYLSSFDGSSSAPLPNPTQAPVVASYLAGFNGMVEAQLSPPRPKPEDPEGSGDPVDITTERKWVFVSSAYNSNSSSTRRMRSFREVAVGCIFLLWQIMM